MKDFWSVKLSSTFLMPAKKPAKEVAPFKQVSKLLKFRKILIFFENSEIVTCLIGIMESLLFKVLNK